MKLTHWNRRPPPHHGVGSGKKGQTMIEFALIAVMLIAAVSIFAVFLHAFKQDSGRTLDLIAYEYP